MQLTLLAFLNCIVIISATKSSCEESLPTIAYVNDCPRNKLDWIERAQKKKCEAVSHDCTDEKDDFGYHCLLNEWGNATLEVCAPERNIVLGNCGEYNRGRANIQDSHLRCKSCPVSYSSRSAYLYSECYDYALKKKRVIQEESRSETKQSSSGSVLLGVVFGGIIFIVIINLTIAGMVFKFYRWYRKKSKYVDEEKNTKENRKENREENQCKTEISKLKEDDMVNKRYKTTDTDECLLHLGEAQNEPVTCTDDDDDANSILLIQGIHNADGTEENLDEDSLFISKY